MLKTSSKTHLLSLAVFAALAIVPMGARAEDGGGDGGEYTLPASNAPDYVADRSENVTCVQATKAAWFQREIELTDGDVTPAMETPRECQREIYATVGEATE